MDGSACTVFINHGDDNRRNALAQAIHERNAAQTSRGLPRHPDWKSQLQSPVGLILMPKLGLMTSRCEGRTLCKNYCFAWSWNKSGPMTFLPKCCGSKGHTSSRLLQ